MTYDKLTVQEFAAICGMWRTNIYEAARIKKIDCEREPGEPLRIVMSPKTITWMTKHVKKESVG